MCGPRRWRRRRLGQSLPARPPQAAILSLPFLLQRVGGQKRAIEQDHDSRGDLFDLGEDVRGDQHGVASRERLNEIANGNDLVRIEPAGRLVQHQHLRSSQQRLRDRDALTEATGELAGQQHHDAGEIQPLGCGVHRGLCRSPSQSLEIGHEVKKLADPHVIVERRVFRHIADHAANRERIGYDIMAGDLDTAGGRHQITSQHAEDRALARAVGPEQADDLAPFDGKGDVGDGAARPVPFGDMLRQHKR